MSGVAGALAYGAMSVVDTVLARRGDRRARRLTKPLLMPLLHVAVRSRGAGRRDRLWRALTVAHAGSWAGDVALLGRGDRAFLSGVGSFAMAHAAYIAGFASVRDEDADHRRPGVRGAVLVWLLAAPPMAVGAGRTSPALRGPVAAYAAILAAMFAASTILDPRLPSGATRRITAGTGLFLLSDALIGTKEFLVDGPSPALEAGVMATYTAGQWLIADGIARTGQRED